MEELSAEAHKLAGHSFLLGSPQQIAKGKRFYFLPGNFLVLYEEMGFTNQSGSNSTSEGIFLLVG